MFGDAIQGGGAFAVGAGLFGALDFSQFARLRPRFDLGGAENVGGGGLIIDQFAGDFLKVKGAAFAGELAVEDHCNRVASSRPSRGRRRLDGVDHS